jgi:hypothetical protein
VKNRPWQGTTLAVLYVIGIVITAIVAIAMIFGISFLGQIIDQAMAESGSSLGSLGANVLMIIGLVVMLPITILMIFVAMGIFKGKRWAIIVALVFTALSLLSTLGGSINWFSLAIALFMLYCEIMCLRDPFYK